MSRAIKYRVWWKGVTYQYADGRPDQVYPARWMTGNDCIVKPDGTLAQEDYELCTISNPEDYVVEQFTGLLDCDGKEIYEGDIVKASVAEEGGDVTDERTKQVGRICYRSDTAGYSLCHTLHDSPYRVDISVLFLRGAVSQRLEIIGNIHENPDLIPKT